MTTPEQNKAIVRRAYEEAWNNRNVDALDDLLPINYDMHEGNPDEGRNAIKDQIRSYHAAFPDLHVTIEDLIAEGDKVVMRGTWRGTHQGPIETEYGIAQPTHTQCTWTGTHVFRIENGRIAEAFYAPDRLARLQQLGVLPTPPTAYQKTERASALSPHFKPQN
jgi:predicted ester cyclase